MACGILHYKNLKKYHTVYFQQKDSANGNKPILYNCYIQYNSILYKIIKATIIVMSNKIFKWEIYFYKSISAYVIYLIKI